MGMRKRVGMARALITEPQVLLFDEPNTGLDPLVGQEVYELINSCRSKWGFTGVVISHELPEVFQVSDRVAMLLNGKIIIEGTPEELKRSANPAVSQFLNGKVDGPIKIQ
jgi:phospholipid/cholesterol/gamma-HCH transport system ATP-binding protein